MCSVRSMSATKESSAGRSRRYSIASAEASVLMRSLEVTRLGTPHRPPGVPRDLEDHKRDHQPHDRVCEIEAERDTECAHHDSQRDEAVDACVISVSDQRRARKSPSGPEPHLRGNLVPEEADDARERQRAEIRERLGVDEADDGLVERNTGGDEYREDDEEPRDPLGPKRPKQKGDADWDRRCGVPEVVDEVGEQGNGVRNGEDRQLRKSSEPQDPEADRDGPEAGARAHDRAFDQPVRVTMPSSVLVLVAVVVVIM